MHINDVVNFRSDRLFHGAVNIDWFSVDNKRAQAAANAFVFHGPEYHGVVQTDVGIEHGHRLQDTAGFVRSIVRRCCGLEDQPFTLAIAGYGTGKSHLGLTLASLLSQSQGESAMTVLSAIDDADRNIGSEIRAILLEAEQPCLVVALNGMQNYDLTTEVTRQITRQIKDFGLDARPLDELRPRFSQAASLIGMAKEDVIKELVDACDGKGIDDILTGLKQQDEGIYSQVHHVFSAKGMPITALGGESLRDIIDVVVRVYCGKEKPFLSLVILFDEFGRYMEFATTRSQIAGSGVLQDLFEAIQTNGNSACFVGFIQFELNAYVQRIAPEYKNEILRYITRYQSANRVYLSINLETLIANLFDRQKPEIVNRWFDTSEAVEESKEIWKTLARWFPQSQNHRIWKDSNRLHSVIRKGCWPLSAYSTWFLVHLAAAGKHLQERSALTLLGDAFLRFKDASLSEDSPMVLAPVDFWSDDLKQELLNAEDSGQQGSIAHAYVSVDARHGAQLTDDLNRLLRAVVLASKMGLKASHRGDAAYALAELAGRDCYSTNNGLRLLQEEYNVLEWDERFNEFDILGDAVPRTQFLSFLRQRVANAYDEAGKAALFARKASSWCDLLGDMECDFAEENKITTREWRYQAVTTNLDLLPMQVKLAADRWSSAFGVDAPRGTLIYCYVELTRDSNNLDVCSMKLLRKAAEEAGVSALPILIVLLQDEEGVLGQTLAELAVLEESVSSEDQVRFGNLIPAHRDKNLQILKVLIESKIKQRRYITGLREELNAQRLSRVLTELFNRIYEKPMTFPFDGFSTARGNAADSCQELTTELLLGKLDFDAVISKPPKVKNRAITVLMENWGIFAQNGGVRKRPSYPLIKAITEKWDDALNSDHRGLSVNLALRQLCMPPYGANLASAGLFLGVFVAPRIEKLVVVRNGQQVAISQWIQDDIFRNKFIDLSGLRDVDLMLLGDESSEWEILLDDWEQAENYSSRKDCLQRANDLKSRVPVPPSLVYKEQHFREQGETAVKAIEAMDKQQNKAIQKVESGIEKRDISLLSWGAVDLHDLRARMSKEKPLWSDYQIEEIQPFLDRARPAINQYFSEWLNDQTPRDDTPAAVADFKDRMLNKIGNSLGKLGLDSLLQKLQVYTGSMIRNAETIAEAHQLIREVRNWLLSHDGNSRIEKIAQIRDLRDVGKKFAAKLRGMAERIQISEIGEVRKQLSEILGKMKGSEEDILKRASRLWNANLRSEDDVEKLLEEVSALIAIFENCPIDLEDYRRMQSILQLYQKYLKDFENENLSWVEFEEITNTSIQKIKTILGPDEEEFPWPPEETLNKFAAIASERRKKISKIWIESFESELSTISSMSGAEANRLYNRAKTPPAILTESHSKHLAKLLQKIEKRLDELKIEWLVEKYKELSTPLRKEFLRYINTMPVK